MGYLAGQDVSTKNTNVCIVDDAGRCEPVFLQTLKPEQRFHLQWWTTLPAIPATREQRAYRRLWRLFADHTMNTLRSNNNIFVPGSRGFYIEGREDHLVPAFFENFGLFTDFRWLEDLLTRLAIPRDGTISNAAWSYSYEEVLAGERRPRIADIVIMWRDKKGAAVLVIEAKKPGCRRAGLTEKDYPDHRYYLNYKAMHSIERRHQALLVDKGDLRYLPDAVHASPSVVTWQELITIQECAIGHIAISDDLRNIIMTRLTAHYGTLSLIVPATPLPNTRASTDHYAELRSLDAPACVKDWLIGSELFFAAHNQDSLIELPYEWLAHEPTVLTYEAAGRMKHPFQTTQDREAMLWRI